MKRMCETGSHLWPELIWTSNLEDSSPSVTSGQGQMPEEHGGEYSGPHASQIMHAMLQLFQKFSESTDKLSNTYGDNYAFVVLEGQYSPFAITSKSIQS